MRYIIPVILIFAFVGLGFELLFNTLGFLTRILMIVGFIAVIFLIYRWVMAKRYGTSLFPQRSGPTRSQLRKAKRTSTKRANTSASSSATAPAFIQKRKPNQAVKHKSARPAKNRKEAHHLTVIEGKKSKKKSRAFF